MKLKKKYNTPRKQFEALDDLNCFMATFYALEHGRDIDEGNISYIALISIFSWSRTEEGADHWNSVYDRLLEIVFE